MAEAILFDIAGEIIKTLASGAVEKIGLWWGLSDEIKRLKNTVSAIQAVLLDAEDRQAEDHQIKDWLAKLKEVMYDADDLLDDFSTEALQRQVRSGGGLRKEVRLFFSSSNRIAYGTKMGQKIKEIRERLDAIAEDGRKFQFVRRMTDTRSLGEGRDQTHSFAGEGEVIGRDKDKMAILELLLEPSTVENVLVVPIVGIGGLGKTTLAQFVYNDERVIKNFHLRMWVCVSDVFDVKTIVEKVIKSATNRKPEDLELDQLQSQLRKEIDGKKYLLVLDDIWNEDPKKWFELEKLLMCGATGSRIIVTTRAEKVAMVTSKIRPYVLKGLSLDESWSLFVQIVFKGQEPKNPEIVTVGKEIVRRCAGVPLAIKTIASLLFFKEPETEWLPFMENELSTISQNENDILPTLRLSYYHLPSHLKHCFAYCSLFPKDYEIQVKTLIHLWIAQGFIQSSSQSQCLEEVGLEFFKDLLWRSFFQEVEFSRNREMVTCKMHDLMHDLATLVSGSEITISNSNVEKVDEKTRHVSFDFNVDSTWKITNNLLAAKGLRTFLLPVQNRWSHDETLESSTCEAIFSNLRKLRVLDLKMTLGEEIPVSIKKLKHLRYFDASYSGIRLLPDSFTKLQNLQVLRLASCHALEELPNDIERLLNLRHLDCDHCYSLTYMPRGIGQLTSLQTLTYFVVAKEDIPASKLKQVGGLNILNRLNNLRGRLAIENLHFLKNHKSECEAANLKEKQHLESLSLCWDRTVGGNRGDADYDEVSLESLQPHPNVKTLEIHCYRGVKFPNWFSSLTNLAEVTLFCCRRCKQLPPLESIRSLKHLSIYRFPDLEYIDCREDDCFGTERGQIEGESSFFPALKTLELEECPNLKGWWKKIDDATTIMTTAARPQFPCLSTLKIRDCPKLAWMPLFPTLDENLRLRDASTKLVEQTIKMKITTPTSIHIPATAAAGASTSSSSSSSSFTSSQPLSQLKKLDIGRNDDLEYLPEEWLKNLNCLRELCIRNCTNFKSLPDGLHHLTSLQLLRIRDCPKLTEVCGNNRGMDWPKIAHIPNIKIDGRKVQWEGRYRLDDDDVSTHFSDDSLF